MCDSVKFSPNLSQMLSKRKNLNHPKLKVINSDIFESRIKAAIRPEDRMFTSISTIFRLKNNQDRQGIITFRYR
jgi:hypothetical protein